MTVSVLGRLSERTDHGHAYTRCEWKPFAWLHPQSRGQHHSAKETVGYLFPSKEQRHNTRICRETSSMHPGSLLEAEGSMLVQAQVPKLRNIVKRFFDIPSSGFRVENLVGNDTIHGSASLESWHPIPPGSRPARQISQLRWL